jgi:AcrR family transcriptional regulator
MLQNAAVPVPLDTRTRILDAAHAIYSRSGTKGTTTREVADLAGVNEATLFRHFGNKQALLDAMMERNSNVEEFYEILRNVPAELGPALYHLGVALVAKMREKRAMIAISVAEDAITPSASECAWRGPSAMVSALADFFQLFIDRGEMRGDAVFNARMFMGIFYSYIMAQKLWGSEYHDPTVVAACVDLFLNGVQS